MPTFNRALFNSLNNTFVNDAKITEMIRYLIDEQFPEIIDTAQKQNLYQKQASQYNVVDDVLVFIPLGLKVIPKSKTREVLEELYTNEDAGIGKGIVALYKFVRRHYINLTRADVASFIQNQTNYQLTIDVENRVNKLIISYYPNSLWCLDLIDMFSYEKQNSRIVI